MQWIKYPQIQARIIEDLSERGDLICDIIILSCQILFLCTYKSFGWPTSEHLTLAHHFKFIFFFITCCDTWRKMFQNSSKSVSSTSDHYHSRTIFQYIFSNDYNGYLMAEIPHLLFYAVYELLRMSVSLFWSLTSTQLYYFLAHRTI